VEKKGGAAVAGGFEEGEEQLIAATESEREQRPTDSMQRRMGWLVAELPCLGFGAHGCSLGKGEDAVEMQRWTWCLPIWRKERGGLLLLCFMHETPREKEEDYYCLHLRWKEMSRWREGIGTAATGGGLHGGRREE
jgi:hypothetical protein